ncbi:MAG: pyrroline-5-carboxylate reductase [Paracoccaceae bacterium]
MRLGFVGTGAIAEAMVQGVKGSDLADWPVTVSPRNAAVAARLAQLPGVTVGADNQAVVDGADIVVLSVLPGQAEQVLRPLRFRDGQTLLSLVAATPHQALQGWLDRDLAVVRATPLPFAARQACVTPVFPPEPLAMRLFDALGAAVPVTTQAQFDGYSAGSAIMGTYFGLVDTAIDWLQAQGLPRADADAYMRSVFGNLGDVLRANPQATPEELRLDHSTPGGLNQQVHDRFTAAGGGDALRGALDSVMARLRR